MLVMHSSIYDLVKKSRYTVAALPLVLSIPVTFISVPPKEMHNSMPRFFPFEVSGESTTNVPMEGPTEKSVVYLTF